LAALMVMGVGAGAQTVTVPASAVGGHTQASVGIVIPPTTSTGGGQQQWSQTSSAPWNTKAAGQTRCAQLDGQSVTMPYTFSLPVGYTEIAPNYSLLSNAGWSGGNTGLTHANGLVDAALSPYRLTKVATSANLSSPLPTGQYAGYQVACFTMGVSQVTYSWVSNSWPYSGSGTLPITPGATAISSGNTAMGGTYISGSYIIFPQLKSATEWQNGTGVTDWEVDVIRVDAPPF
jgi:hypothetical protein